MRLGDLACTSLWGSLALWARTRATICRISFLFFLQNFLFYAPFHFALCSSYLTPVQAHGHALFRLGAPVLPSACLLSFFKSLIKWWNMPCATLGGIKSIHTQLLYKDDFLPLPRPPSSCLKWECNFGHGSVSCNREETVCIYASGMYFYCNKCDCRHIHCIEKWNPS